MSRTTDVILKAQETPWLLSPSERAFVGMAGPQKSATELHIANKRLWGPCDCPDCAPGLYPPKGNR